MQNSYSSITLQKCFFPLLTETFEPKRVVIAVHQRPTTVQYLECSVAMQIPTQNEFDHHTGMIWHVQQLPQVLDHAIDHPANAPHRLASIVWHSQHLDNHSICVSLHPIFPVSWQSIGTVVNPTNLSFHVDPSHPLPKQHAYRMHRISLATFWTFHCIAPLWVQLKMWWKIQTSMKWWIATIGIANEWVQYVTVNDFDIWCLTIGRLQTHEQLNDCQLKEFRLSTAGWCTDNNVLFYFR